LQHAWSRDTWEPAKLASTGQTMMKWLLPTHIT
jgi:hypothetical protein